MFGFLLTDGSAGIYHNGRPQIQVTAGHPYSIELFEQDVVRLGFNRCAAIEVWNEVHGSRHHCWQVCNAGPIASLFIALGLMTGKRTTQTQVPVPVWIMEGSMSVKREFLAGIQGGDGCKIRCNRVTSGGHNVVCAATYMSKIPEHASSLEHFTEQLCAMFSEFGVEAKTASAPGKYGKIQVGPKMSDREDNHMTYIYRICYRYHIHNIQEAGQVIEYLRFKHRLKAKYLAVQQEILNRHERGDDSRSIADGLGISIHSVRDRLRHGIPLDWTGKPTVRPKLAPNQQWEHWEATVPFKTGCLFVPIESLELTDIVDIADITTASPNHSFFGGDLFCVHNSAMSKQAAGMPALNMPMRMDTMAHVLWYPQKPICQTAPMDAMNFNELPAGQNCVVAIITSGGLACFSPCRIGKGYGKSALSWRRS
jgi:hypothetical protein